MSASFMRSSIKLIPSQTKAQLQGHQWVLRSRKEAVIEFSSPDVQVQNHFVSDTSEIPQSAHSCRSWDVTSLNILTLEEHG
ncbi:hypothetical protein M404DRAFT_1000151 [Pisolithus tinctorius Marx 270]|uniref:Uncharacterized protein n=1 Tax=Pisolithus tinctorius Marx 270 TaxID=870435 RepID=A0A0C3J7T2_PISTI|nr:hypothetical protein M404DRAFT_1000151 [Pisolithus tinctorius Marx 270]